MPSLPLRRYEDIIQERQNLSSAVNFELPRSSQNKLVVWGSIKYSDLVATYILNQNKPSAPRDSFKLGKAHKVGRPSNFTDAVKSVLKFEGPSFKVLEPLKVAFSWANKKIKLWQTYTQKKGTLWDSLRIFKNWGLRVIFLAATLSTGAGVFLSALHIFRIIPSMEKLVSLYGATAICLFMISLPLGLHRILKEKFYSAVEPGLE